MLSKEVQGWMSSTRTAVTMECTSSIRVDFSLRWFSLDPGDTGVLKSHPGRSSLSYTDEWILQRLSDLSFIKHR